MLTERVRERVHRESGPRIPIDSGWLIVITSGPAGLVRRRFKGHTLDGTDRRLKFPNGRRQWALMSDRQRPSESACRSVEKMYFRWIHGA